MSRYCKGCGAYIPDALGVCLSCGKIQYPADEKKTENPPPPDKRVVLPAPRIEGRSPESCIDLRPLFYHKTDVILPGTSFNELKDAKAEVAEFNYLPFVNGRQSDGRFERVPGLAEVTIRIVGKPCF